MTADAGRSGRGASFRWEEWSADFRKYAQNAKEGIDLSNDHGERLARFHLYLQRVNTLLKKLPDIGSAIEPLETLQGEIDLLVHHHTSDLLRPAKLPRADVTVADKRLRAHAAACVRLFRQVGAGEEQSRKLVSRIIAEKGYKGSKGKFGPDELSNWVSKIESGELPGAEHIDALFRRLPSLRGATTLREAEALSREILGRIRFPPLSGAQAKRERPIT